MPSLLLLLPKLLLLNNINVFKTKNNGQPLKMGLLLRALAAKLVAPPSAQQN